MRALIVVVALASAARAEPILATQLKGSLTIVEYETYETKKTWNRLGTRVNYGAMKLDDRSLSTSSIAVSFDRAVAGRARALRVLGEYEYMWLGPYDVDEQMKTGAGSLPDNGHRMNLGLRMMCVEKFWVERHFGVWLDAELGAGAMVIDRELGGVVATPHAFVGARFGMSLLWDQDEEESRGDTDRWDYEIVLRGLAMPEGFGVLFGIGLAWGK